MLGPGALGQGHDLVVGEHSGLVGRLPAGAAERLAAGVAVVHPSCVLDGETITTMKLHEEKHTRLKATMCQIDVILTLAPPSGQL